MRLIKALTKDQHQEILALHPMDTEAAKVYTDRLGTEVSRQLVRYWRKIFSTSKPKADASIIRDRMLRTPSPTDDVGELGWMPEECNSVLVIGDIHAPYQHPDMIPFLEHVKRTFSPDCVIQIGDETDGHALSFHESDPNLDSAGAELDRARRVLDSLHSLFPRMLICHSNHGSLIYRRARNSGIPVQMIRSYREILFPDMKAPGWSWAYSWRVPTPVGDVMFKHQPAGDVLGDAAHEGYSLVVGHLHGKASIEWGASSQRLYFGAHTGCLIDKDSLAFAYGRDFKLKPIISVLLILNGIPAIYPMNLDDDGRWVYEEFV